MKKILLIFIMLATVALTSPVTIHALESFSETSAAIETVNPNKKVLTTENLNDGGFSALAISEPQVDSSPDEKYRPVFRDGLIKWLQSWFHVIDQHEEEGDQGIFGLLLSAPTVHADLIGTLKTIGGSEELDGLFQNLLFAAFIMLAGFIVELIFRKMTAQLTRQLADIDPKSELGPGRLWGAVLHILPQLVHVTVFAFASAGIFILTLTYGIQSVRTLFMAILLAIVMARSMVIISDFLFSPYISGLRLIPLGDAPASIVHRSVKVFAWYIAFGLMFIALLDDLGAASSTIQVVGLFEGSILIFLIVLILLAKKKAVRDSILNVEPGEEVSWLRQQFASSWHILAIFYLFGIWLVWLNTMVSGTGGTSGALLISLIIIPSYLFLDQIGQWLVGTVVKTLNIFKPPGEKTGGGTENEQAFKDAGKKEARLKMNLLRLMRLFIGMVLVLWLLSLWGFTLPFAASIVRGMFDILLTLTLAILFWRMASGYIERKLSESYGDEEKEEEVEDSGEFGVAKQRGRDYTILPLLRKFIATTLLVMVTLIILSSLGVNIGPLLAGAGVVGIALGFGAQKLVSDILSGIFNLLDDAFRVGEYIEAGSTVGSVEAITLRNVMLRHPRGMLQIIPHSELGAITNFMRGGIIVKFNLEFPYDTDVNKVRKVIKKVGKEMLEDPEMGPDFIKPLKSQGVREIANSVMVIRGKFTAHPGKHFLIRREAYRRISEALAAKGIHYAHRKVIVEVPNLEEKKDMTKDDRMRQILEAGAAASQTTLDSGQKKEAFKDESPF